MPNDKGKKSNTQDNADSEKHYEWHLLVGNTWLQIDSDHVIESHYCQPGAKGITINTSQGNVFIDFDELQTPTAAPCVHRLSCLPPGQTEDIGWYFRDDQLWCEYGSESSGLSASSVSSKDIEQHFSQNPQGSFMFTVGSIDYLLDFSTMTQMNRVTGLCRNVRRRPKFSSSCFLKTAVQKKKNIGQKLAAALGMTKQGPGTVPPDPSKSSLPKAQQQPPAGGAFTVRVAQAASALHKLSFGSKPQWQFEGDSGAWNKYKHRAGTSAECSINSKDIEKKFQLNPQESIMFQVSGRSYKLDLGAMIQTNLQTNRTRKVRRVLV